jgi:integrase
MPTPKKPIKKLPTGVEQLPSGMYRTRLRINGGSKSATHLTLAESKLWLEREKYAMRQLSAQGLSAKITLAKAVERYVDEVCVLHRGEQWERVRWTMMLRYLPSKQLSEFTQLDIVAFKAERLLTVSPATVRREMGMVSAFFEHCRKEWRYVTANPCIDIARPKAPKHRERIVSELEITAICAALGYHVGETTTQVSTQQHQVAITVLLAVETGMRSGEIVGLEWENVHLEQQFVRLDMTKNGTARDVPLSKAAVALFEAMRGINAPHVFNLQNASRDALFRRARNKAGLLDVHFHDLRHTAATRLAQKVHALDLCKIMGWHDPKYALIYFNPTAQDIAARLD